VTGFAVVLRVVLERLPGCLRKATKMEVEAEGIMKSCRWWLRANAPCEAEVPPEARGDPHR